MQKLYINPIPESVELKRGPKRSAYFKQLLHPESEGYGGKCPSVVAIPSCTLQDREMTDIVIGAGGEAYLSWCPGDVVFSATTSGNGPIPLHILSAANAGHTYGGTFAAPTAPAAGGWATNVDVGDIRTGVGQHMRAVRIVSASLQISYQGRADACSGKITSGVVFTTEQHSGLRAIQAAYKNNLINLEYFCQQNSHEGLRVLYFPIDENSFEFSESLNLAAADKNRYDARACYLIAITGAPPGTSFQVIQTINYEYIPVETMRELLQPKEEASSFFSINGLIGMAKSAVKLFTGNTVAEHRQALEQSFTKAVDSTMDEGSILTSISSLFGEL